VRQVLSETTPATLHGRLTIGPTRTSTAGGSCWENAEPAFKLNAGGRMAVAHNGNLTNTAAMAGQLISQEWPASWPVQPWATSDSDLLTHLLGRNTDLSLEGTLLRTMPGLEDLTRNAIHSGIGPIRGPCAAWGTERFPSPIPGAAVAELRPFVTTQSATLPLPNPESEVAR
jgi:glutamine phosphoribosylpyrophosphate amidotransferase